jgi:hypothetical protein
VLPLLFYLGDGFVPKYCFFPVQNVKRIYLELSLGFHMHHVPINDVGMIMNIPFSNEKHGDLRKIPNHCHLFFMFICFYTIDRSLKLEV